MGHVHRRPGKKKEVWKEEEERAVLLERERGDRKKKRLAVPREDKLSVREFAKEGTENSGECGSYQPEGKPFQRRAREEKKKRESKVSD